MTLGRLIEKFTDDVKIVLREWQFVGRSSETDSEEWDDVEIFRGTIGDLKKSKFISGDHLTSRYAHIPQDFYVDVTGTVQVCM